MTSDFAATSDAQPPVFARPQKELYVIIGIWAIVGLGLLLTIWLIPVKSTRPDAVTSAQFSVLLAVIFLLPCFIFLWLMRRLCVVADARGLWFRGALRQSFVPWQNVEDYELRPPLQSGAFKSRWIRHDAKWRRLPQGFAPMDALQTRIRDEAKWSRAREWQLNIERADGNWPKTYAYADPSGRRAFGFAVAGALFICGASYWPVFSPQSLESTRLIWNNLELWGRIGSLLMPLIVLLLLALLLWPHLAILRAKQRLGHQIISADRDGLTLLDGKSQTRIAWPEVTDYGIEDAPGRFCLPQYVVESAYARVVFRREIESSGELKALVRAQAVNAQSNDWRARESADSDTLGGETTLWPSGTVGVGRKVYHYRTRIARALLGLGGAMLLVFPIRILGLVPLRDGQMPTTPDRLIGLVFVVPVVALTLGGALAFWRASIQTDDDGIYQRGIWSQRFLRWNEIETFTFNGYFYTVKGVGAPIRYWLVAASESLQAEIEDKSGVKMRRTDRPNDDE